MGFLYDPLDRDRIRVLMYQIAGLKEEIEKLQVKLEISEDDVQDLIGVNNDLRKTIAELQDQIIDEQDLHESAREDAETWKEKYERELKEIR